MTQQHYEKYFQGVNEGYVLDLYDRYKQDPASVDAITRAVFEQWTPTAVSLNGSTAAALSTSTVAQITKKAVGAANYAQAIREYGHLAAQLDPLGSTPIGDPSLSMEAHGLTADDLKQLPASVIGGAIAEMASNALEALTALRSVYSSRIGYDYDHIREPAEREWLRHAAESRMFSTTRVPLEAEKLLERLTRVEIFEQFIHRIFPGKHRFSIEGLDIMVPILDLIIGEAGATGVRSIILGMAHRGRLNVLAHILNKPYEQMLAEFKDPVSTRRFRDDLGWTGDVKYHSGAMKVVKDGVPMDVMVSLAPNPSHLEAVNPVVEGMARAFACRVDQPGEPEFDPHAILPILIHGDAAFPGQGIVAETLNLSRLQGYWTGGTIHIIANNQLGYTTEPRDSRSTIYASDLAKGFKMPIVHVNADDPESCIEVARLAFAYQEKFEKDFLIDLIGYRRYGHNEGDEPAFTQPVMYKVVQQHPTVRSMWAARLIERKQIDPAVPEALVKSIMDELQAVLTTLNPESQLHEPLPEIAPKGTAKRKDTSLPLETLREINAALLSAAPEGFNFHPKLVKARQRRMDNMNDPDASTIDWATAEELAFATILAEGIAIRLTGQDVERGTFNQRHAVFHDPETNAVFIPLQRFKQAKASFEIRNSPLSENAALGFEYGYNVQAPERLVVWEAQYGDFINGGQTIVDEFITSARSKWGQTPSLVLLLPHGYEGAGPDHSSGRLERFLQSAAETSIRICYPTTAAQCYHLLRRQALLLTSDPLPLIVMTPKSLLRNELVASPLRDLAEGHWQPVIDDHRARTNPADVRTLLLCSGKVYVDLVSSLFREEFHDVAIARVEQLYPFPTAEVRSVIAGYPNLNEVVWVQEEPENMGAWEFARPLVQEILGDQFVLRYVGRARSSSPAEGSAAWHAANQKALIKRAFGRELESDIREVVDIIRQK